jgi:DNA (cytosine-5)-methyltransferase 1
MTTRECARLQSLDELKHLPPASTRAYKALGNAVNAEVVKKIAGLLLQHESSQTFVSAGSGDALRRAASA